MRAIITTSEKLTPQGRELIARGFGCPVHEEYGQVEDAAWAIDAPDGRLRLSPDAAIVELLRPDGSVVSPSSEEQGNVVATSFVRRRQLLIRYRVGDIATWDTRPDASGKGMPLLREIIGRIEEAVIGPDGRRFSQFYGVFSDVPSVREAQVIQEARDLLRIRVVPADGYGSQTVQQITERVQQRMTSSMRVIVEAVGAIERTKAGKFAAVINRLPPENSSAATVDTHRGVQS